MVKKNKIQVFWWSSVKFENKPQENFGDILSKYLVEKISGKPAIWKNPNKQTWNLFKKPVYFTTGSILAHVRPHCVVWGSGIISKKDYVANAKFLAVRGPETYKYLVRKGYSVTKVFGDPAIVLPEIYKPNVTKKYKLGIIPHYVDFDLVSGWYKNNSFIKVINLLNNDVETVIKEIVSCKKILSSSLHGVIVAHTYEVPAVWVEFSKKLSGDGIKFVDYFKSVKIEPYSAPLLSEAMSLEQGLTLIDQFPNLPEFEVLKTLCEKLMEVCPFKA